MMNFGRWITILDSSFQNGMIILDELQDLYSFLDNWFPQTPFPLPSSLIDFCFYYFSIIVQAHRAIYHLLVKEFEKEHDTNFIFQCGGEGRVAYCPQLSLRQLIIIFRIYPASPWWIDLRNFQNICWVIFFCGHQTFWIF